MIPYQNLYVYEISGEISDSKAFFKEDFIGCWNEGEILILLDPCVVFGTGYHPTTRSCLKALWNLYQKEKPATVLDLGTGTGILALAAVKWGARRVLTVDCNELAAETASRNVKLNVRWSESR